MGINANDLPEACKRLNPHLFGRAPQSPQPERAVRNEPLATTPREKGNTGRFLVRIRSFRKRLIDPDNLTPKFFVDCCRYAGFIPNDTAKDIALEVSQEKSADERTEITIETL